MKRKRFAALGTAIGVAVLIMGLLLAGCRLGGITTQTSHMSGPLDITLGGSESAPAFYLAGDSDTGIYQSAADNFDFTAAGSNVVNLSAAGIALSGGISFTLGATDKVLIDGDATNQTQTGGALDINVGTTTADVSGFNVGVTGDDGTATGTDVFGGVLTLTQNDADADMFGLKIVAAATANAAADSYEYGISYDCAEDTAGACEDGILLTSTGANTGMTDGLDVSATNIEYAVNIGSNPILGGDEQFTIGATDDTAILTRSESGSATYTCADDDVNATCIYDSGGTGSVQVGSPDSASVDILGGAITVTTTLVDMGGLQIDLDVDGDTSITADTDDQIEIEINAGDEYSATATALYLNANELVFDADQDTSIAADTDDQVDVKIGGADVYTLTASIFDFGGKRVDFDVDNDTSLRETSDDTLTWEIGGSDVYTMTDSIFDLGGKQFDLDVDNDTSITADSDDQIDVEISGSDEYSATATAAYLNANELMLDADQDTSITADTDDQVDVKIGGADVYTLTAAIFDLGGKRLDLDDDNDTSIIASTDDTVVFEVSGADTYTMTAGILDLGGKIFDLDVDNDTSITADTDDQVDFEISAADEYSMTASALYLNANELVFDADQDSSLSADTDDQIDVRLSGGDVMTFTTTGFDVGGLALTVDVDDDTTIIASQDDVITFTLGASSGYGVFATGNLRVGDGVPGETHDGEDFYCEGISEFDGAANFDGTVDMDAALTAVTTTIGTSGVGMDVIFHSLTADEELTWDASEEQLILDGINAATVLDVTDGNVVINDDLTVTAGAFDVTAGATTVETMTVGTSGVGTDVIFHSLTGADELTWDASAICLDIEGTDGTNALRVLDGNVNFADALVVAGSGGVDVSGGDITLQNDETICNSQDDVITFTVTTAAFSGSVDVATDLDVDGTTNLDAVDIDGAIDIAGQTITWDDDSDTTSVASQDDVITHTIGDAAGYLVVATGNLKVGDADPTISLGGEDAYVEGTFEADGIGYFDGGVEINGTVTLENDETIVNSQDGVITATVASDGYLVVAVGNLKVGDGTPDDSSLDAEDAYVEGEFEVDGSAYFDGAVDMDSTLDVAGAVALASDVTLATDSTGGNALAKNEFIGLPRIKMVALSTLADGTGNTSIVDIGDTQTPTDDWTAVDGDTVLTDDASIYREGTHSLKMEIKTTAVEDDGMTNPLGTGDQDWSDDEGFGFWLRCDSTMAAGDLQLVVSDSVAADVKFNLPAYSVADIWQWSEIDVTTANANKDVLEDILITLTANGGTKAGVAAWNCYFDFMVKWDVAEEESLGVDIPYDGVLSVIVNDVTSGAATNANIAEYTDYFVHYQSTDAIVMITDQSNADKLGIALIAY